MLAAKAVGENQRLNAKGSVRCKSVKAAQQYVCKDAHSPVQGISKREKQTRWPRYTTTLPMLALCCAPQTISLHHFCIPDKPHKHERDLHLREATKLSHLSCTNSKPSPRNHGTKRRIFCSPCALHSLEGLHTSPAHTNAGVFQPTHSPAQHWQTNLLRTINWRHWQKKRRRRVKLEREAGWRGANFRAHQRGGSPPCSYELRKEVFDFNVQISNFAIVTTGAIFNAKGKGALC